MSRRLTFGDRLRQALAAGPPTEAEREAYLASPEYAREQREARAAWAEHERDRRPARNPAPTVTTARTTPRTRERRDTGARQTVATGDDSDPGEPPALVAALAYAGRGWLVVLLEAGAKDPNANRKACPNAVHSATTDPDRIRSWFWRWPDSNIGIATGRPGPTVQDVDDLDTRARRSPG